MSTKSFINQGLWTSLFSEFSFVSYFSWLVSSSSLILEEALWLPPQAAKIQNNLIIGCCSTHSGVIEPRKVCCHLEKSHRRLNLIAILSFSECFPIFALSSKNSVCCSRITFTWLWIKPNISSEHCLPEDK